MLLNGEWKTGVETERGSLTLALRSESNTKSNYGQGREKSKLEQDKKHKSNLNSYENFFFLTSSDKFLLS